MFPAGDSPTGEKGPAPSAVLTNPTRPRHNTLPGAPPIKYIRQRIPQAKVPIPDGTYYDATIPDTLDPAKRARLVVNTFSQTACPEADYEIYTLPDFSVDPLRLVLQSSSGLCWPKHLSNINFAARLS
jgi:hypothetical protein